jgi:ribulose 1,5-bisphosphate synthetase/thiazole synthase
MLTANLYCLLATIVLMANPVDATNAIREGSTASRIIYSDVVILGGGASGAHAAVRLRQDFNKTVVVVEKNNKLVRIAALIRYY